MHKVTLPVPEAVLQHHGQTLFGPMKEWVNQRKLPPVLLITGISGVGKRTIAYFLAQWIHCEQSGFAKTEDEGPDLFGGSSKPEPASGQTLPCGKCSACQKAINGSWVDFTEILPEEEEGTLKIDQFRKLKSTMGFGAHEGGYKIIVIPNADRMTVQAANSVLKILEEPPKGWIFFLTASDPTLVLPTITSRCQKLRLKPFSLSSLYELLNEAGVSPERRRICAELAQGSWSKAFAYASDEIWEHRKEIFQFVKNPGGSVNALIEWASQEGPHFDYLIDQLEHMTSELIKWSISENRSDVEKYPWTNQDGRQALTVHAKSLSEALGSADKARSFWLERSEGLARARQYGLLPMNRKLLIQDILLPWVRISH